MPRGTHGLTRVRLAAQAMATRFEILIDHHHERTARAGRRGGLGRNSQNRSAAFVLRSRQCRGACEPWSGHRSCARACPGVRPPPTSHGTARLHFGRIRSDRQAGRRRSAAAGNGTLAAGPPGQNRPPSPIGARPSTWAASARATPSKEALGILREAGIKNALLHGGTSTAHALGTDQESHGESHSPTRHLTVPVR